MTRMIVACSSLPCHATRADASINAPKRIQFPSAAGPDGSRRIAGKSALADKKQGSPRIRHARRSQGEIQISLRWTYVRANRLVSLVEARTGGGPA